MQQITQRQNLVPNQGQFRIKITPVLQGTNHRIWTQNHTIIEKSPSADWRKQKYQQRNVKTTVKGWGTLWRQN